MTDLTDGTRCSDCGELIDESMDTPQGRAPCKKCGSTNRVIGFRSIRLRLLAMDTA